MLAADGALDPSAVHAIRNVALGELPKRGITVIEDRRTDGVQPVKVYPAAFVRLAFQLCGTTRPGRASRCA